jgi:flagellar hook-length control protein FliK
VSPPAESSHAKDASQIASTTAIPAAAPAATQAQIQTQNQSLAIATTAAAPAAAAPTAINAAGVTAPVSAVSHNQALAATITAMHQSGQNSLTLRLDPPGLGSLAIHLASSQSGVNVLFVPSASPTAQLLTQNLDGLRSAMADAGLSLGQAQVGGGGGQNQGQSPGYTPQPSGLTPPPAAATEDDTGVRAYA